MLVTGRIERSERLQSRKHPPQTASTHTHVGSDGLSLSLSVCSVLCVSVHCTLSLSLYSLSLSVSLSLSLSHLHLFFGDEVGREGGGGRTGRAGQGMGWDEEDED